MVDLVNSNQRLVGEPIDEIENFVRIDVSKSTDDRLGRVHRERSCEHPKPPQRGALGGVEQIVTPIDRCLQGLLAGQHGTGPAGEQTEAVIELAGDLLDRQVATASSRQLDR